MHHRLLHPTTLTAAAVLAVNDFLLKRLVPSVLTGKLSDLAGLFLLPILLAAIFGRRAMPWIGFACGIVFAAAKTVPAWIGVEVPWVVDPTDLVALAVLPLSVLHAKGAGEGTAAFFAERPRARLAAFGFVAAATIATPAAQGVRRFPSWETEQPSHVVGGAIVQAWVSRSTREGFGVSIDVACAPGARPVEVDASRTFVRIGRERLRPIKVLPAKAGPGEHARGYLAFEMDGLRAWNDGVHTGMLRLALSWGNEAREIPIALVYAWPDPHGKAEGEIDR